MCSDMCYCIAAGMERVGVACSMLARSCGCELCEETDDAFVQNRGKYGLTRLSFHRLRRTGRGGLGSWAIHAGIGLFSLIWAGHDGYGLPF